MTLAGTAPAAAVNPFGPPCALVNVDGEIVDAAQAAVDVHAHAVSYGTGTFEGIRAYWNGDHGQLYLSEALGHYERLHRSARILGLPLRFPAGQLVEMTKELLCANDVRAHAYVRPILLQSGSVLPVRMHDITVRLSIAVTPLPGDYLTPGGVRCMVSTWRRAPDATIPNRAKVIGSYVGPALAKTEAVRAGYDEALMLTVDGYVAEATTANVIMRFGDTWVTPPGTDDILEGITRAQVMTLLGERTGQAVVQRRVHRSELYVADEVMLCGTAATVAPVVSIDGRAVGDGAIGELTRALRAQLWAISTRAHADHSEWATPVYAKG